MRKVCGVIATAWGHMAAVWSDKGLWELTFPCRSAAAALAALRHGGDVAEGNAPGAAILGKELALYFAGERVAFSAPVDWDGYTPFQAAVLRYTAGIPYGAVASYGEVAAAVGSPRAARAVGGALHVNRTPLVVPCHRVIGANGALVGFGGGLPKKRALLDLEAGRGHDFSCQKFVRQDII